MSFRPSLLHRSHLGADSIREIVFGVEDGVVQNMTLIAGMVGAALSTSVILLAGAINAIAGVLSMSMGTYLSSKAEMDVKMAASGSVADDETRAASPRHDAAVMAAAYAGGALAPLVPFGLGIRNHSVGLAVAVALTAVTLFGLGATKAVLSGQSRVRSGLEMLMLASAAGIAGYLLGFLARELFGLDS